MLRAPSMSGHKDTKIFLMNFSLFVDCCLPCFFCLRPYSQIRRVRGTLGRRAINTTDNSTDFIFRTRSFVSEAVLCLKE